MNQEDKPYKNELKQNTNIHSHKQRENKMVKHVRREHITGNNKLKKAQAHKHTQHSGK